MGGILFDDLRNAGARGRANRVGGNASRSPSEHGQRGRSAFTAGWRAVGAHGLDHYRQGNAQQGGRVAAVRAGPAQRQISCMDQQMALDSDGIRGAGDVLAWRMVVPAVGIFRPDGFWAAFDVAGELRDAYVGIAEVSHWRYFDQQFLGGYADLRRRLA